MLSNLVPVTWHPVFLSPCVQLRLTVAEAVGSMCHLMASDKLEEQIPKLIPAILSLYKKNNEHYVISKVRAGCCISVVSFGFHNLYHLCSKPSAIKKKKKLHLGVMSFLLFLPCIRSESVPRARCFRQHGQQVAGDTTGRPTLGTACTGTCIYILFYFISYAVI